MTLSTQNTVMIHALHASQQSMRPRASNVERREARLGVALYTCTSFLLADIACLRKFRQSAPVEEKVPMR